MIRKMTDSWVEIEITFLDFTTFTAKYKLYLESIQQIKKFIFKKAKITW